MLIVALSPCHFSQRLDFCYYLAPFFCPKKMEVLIFNVLQLYILYCQIHRTNFFYKSKRSGEKCKILWLIFWGQSGVAK